MKNFCKKNLGIVLFVLLAFPRVGAAWFDEIYQEKLQSHWLNALGSQHIQTQHLARQSFLAHPTWSLPIIRQSFHQPQNETQRTQLGWLLGHLGTPQDAANLVDLANRISQPDQQRIFAGAADKIYQRHRRQPPESMIISRVSYQPPSQTSSNVGSLPSGTLQFKVVNPSQQGHLVEVKANLLRVTQLRPPPSRWLWLDAGQSAEAEMPLLLNDGGRKTLFRVELSVYEMAGPKRLAHQSSRFNSR